jgi:hypothetical protein
MAADIPVVPGSTTPTGAAAIRRQMRRVLARVRRDVAQSGEERTARAHGRSTVVNRAGRP